MSMHSLLRTSQPPTPDSGHGLDLLQAAVKAPLDVGETADCCCATAQVRVVMPPVAGQAGRSELRFCAHHYRRSVGALLKAGADIYDARGHWLTGQEQFWAENGDAMNSAAQPSA